MANIAYTKLGLFVNKEIRTFDFNGQLVEVRQYVPLDEKLIILNNIINNSGDEKGFYNFPKLEMNIVLEIIFAYTNIRCTDKQKENRTKLFDNFVSSGFVDELKKNIPEKEWTWLENMSKITIDNIYAYRNSAFGILDTISTDYKDLEFDAEKLQQEIGDPENASFLKEVITKLG